jgi:RNAse (barnase) inhibitor barstar
MSLLSTVSPNAVQSIRAFRSPDLQAEAAATGQHFLYAYCAHALNKQEVLKAIADSFGFPSHFGQNFDALYDCLTDSVHKAGQQNGFVVVIEHLPNTAHFDKELRETLLDVFRDAADYWAKKKIAFRVFYSFE